MTTREDHLLTSVRTGLAPEVDENRLVPLVLAGHAPRSVIAALAAEEVHIVRSDRRSFHLLAARAGETPAAEFFAMLAGGETVALATLPALARASGYDDAALAGYEPMAGCQAYPSYVARLAVQADPTDVVLAIVANFATWGDYCRQLAGALRTRYGYDDAACAFFDFFATGSPELDALAAAALAAAVDDEQRLDTARRYGRLLQRYELMFWNTLADAAVPGQSG